KLEGGLKFQGLASDRNVGLLLNLLGLNPPDGALRGLDGVLIGLRTIDLLVDSLRITCRYVPVVIVIEDLHCIDAASEEVLHRVIMSDEDLKVLMVFTRRPDHLAPWKDHPDVTTLELAALSAEDTTAILRSRLGVTSLPATLARLMTDKAEGNPLFAEEIAGFLVERGMVWPQAGGVAFDAAAVSAALPGSILSVLTARIDRLPAEDRAMLQAASVVGRRFDRDLLAAIIGADDIGPRLHTIEALGLIRSDVLSGDFIFRHALLQNALYGSLLQGSRAALHGKIAEEIERRSRGRLPEVAETLAFHYRQTDRSDKSFEYLAMAAHKSLGIYSLAEAERFSEQALALLDRDPRCADGVALVGLLADMSRLLLLTYQPSRLVRLVDRYRPAVDAIRSRPDSVILLANYGFAASEMCRLDIGLPAAKLALEQALRLDDNRCKAYSRAALVYANAIIGQESSDDSLHQIELAVAEGNETDDTYLQIFVPYVGALYCTHRGMIDRGRAFAADMQERGRAAQDPRAAAMSMHILGWLDVLDGRYQDALARGIECSRLAVTPTDRELGIALTGVAQIACGNHREGAALLWDYRHRAMKNEYRTIGIDSMLGLAMVMAGDISGGVKFLEETIDHYDRAGDATGRCMSRILLSEIYIGFLSRRGRPHLPTLAWNFAFVVGALLVGWKTAEKLLLEVRNSQMYPGVSLYRARAEADLGILYLLAKRKDKGGEYLRRARRMAEELNIGILLQKIDAALADLA
ncbi:MAG: hypothetical protein ABSG76_23115, partial [Xanthobacteraceae bacterium]